MASVEKLKLEVIFNSNEIDEDTIVSDLKDYVQANYGKDVVVKWPGEDTSEVDDLFDDEDEDDFNEENDLIE